MNIECLTYDEHARLAEHNYPRLRHLAFFVRSAPGGLQVIYNPDHPMIKEEPLILLRLFDDIGFALAERAHG